MICPNDGSTLVTRGPVLHCPYCAFNIPPNHKVLEGVYAWVSVDPRGREGFIAAELQPGVLGTLMHSEKEKALELEPIARQCIKSVPGYDVRLVHFSGREVVK